jgi:hypothetical protein
MSVAVKDQALCENISSRPLADAQGRNRVEEEPSNRGASAYSRSRSTLVYL